MVTGVKTGHYNITNAILSCLVLFYLHIQDAAKEAVGENETPCGG